MQIYQEIIMKLELEYKILECFMFYQAKAYLKLKNFNYIKIDPCYILPLIRQGKYSMQYAMVSYSCTQPVQVNFVTEKLIISKLRQYNYTQ